MTFSVEVDHVSSADRSVQELPKYREPPFSDRSADLEMALEMAERKEFDHLIVAGEGGQLAGFRAYLYCFLPETDVDVRIVATTDPDHLGRIHRETGPEDSLVMPVSPPGHSATAVEAALFFMDRGYEIAPVAPQNSSMRRLAETAGLDWFEGSGARPPFNSHLEEALVPAVLTGIDAREIASGVEEMYSMCSPQRNYNPAMNVASAVYSAADEGREKIYAPFFSSRMFGYLPVLEEGLHGPPSPEGSVFVSGGHAFGFRPGTEQRLLGGDDVLTVFFRTETHEEERITVPNQLETVGLDGWNMGKLDGRRMGENLKADYRGMKEALDEAGQPSVTVSLRELSHRSAGKLMGFIQYASVYYGWLEGASPLAQPTENRSKSLGWKNRFTGEEV